VALLLLVEDDPDNVVIVEAVLHQAGHEVVHAREGAAAIDAARRTPPDLVVLDLSLEGALTGLDVCRALRTDPRTASIPVLMLTGWAFDTDMSTGLAAGADDYVTKPFDTTDLHDRIEALLARTATAPPPQH
jgi:DNA-binding response OmpR family regulator